MDSKVVGGALLVTGTTIGAGMLALPIETGLAGFIPSLFFLFAFWLFMYVTALLMLEVNLWMPKDANLISMAAETLGNKGRYIAWVVYLFLLYALTTAYLAGGSPILLDSFESFTGIDLPNWIAPLPFLMFFGLFVYLGTGMVDLLNRFLTFGLLATFLFLTYKFVGHVDLALLTYQNPSKVIKASSFVIASFGYHIIIPSLRTYLDSDIKKIKQALFYGSIIPIITYSTWEALILGIIPVEGPEGVAQIVSAPDSLRAMIFAVKEVVHSPLLGETLRALSFFVIVTSFLGVSLSLSDFLSDGLKVKKTLSGRLMTTCLTFFPPLCFALTGNNIFIVALDYAGAFGVTILLGIFPPLMVYYGRYKKQFKGDYKVPGGKFLIGLTLAFSILVIINACFDKIV